MSSAEPNGSPFPLIPSYLPSRYEICQLTPAHAEWAKAIVYHSQVFCSTIWPLIYPDDKAARLHRCMKAGSYLVDHQIASGMSFGVFDTEYVYKRPESGAVGGKLFWDENEDADRDTLLSQMDFPLISVALSYDQNNPLDIDQVLLLTQELPRFGTLYQIFAALDKRDLESWKAKGLNEVLMRNATSTRLEHAGAKVMKKLAHFLMRYAKLNGYRAIQIEALHDAVTHMWLNVPEPFRADLVCETDLYEYWERYENEEVIYPYRPSKQVATRIYVHL